VIKSLKASKERSSGVAAISIRCEKMNCSSSLAMLQYKRKDYKYHAINIF